MENKCVRCGLRLTSIQTYCPACGFELIRSSETKGPQVSDRKSSSHSNSWPERYNPVPLSRANPLQTFNTVKSNSVFTLGNFIGLRKVSGTVIAVEPPYMVKPETNFPKVLIKIGLFLLFLPIIIGLGIGFFIASKMFSLLFSNRGGQPGFFSTVASQTLSFFFTGKLFGPKDMVPVRDIRLMDKSGFEYLVRIKGDLYAGNVNVGDEIEVEGFNRMGTIVFYRGKNIRTQSAIIVKIR